MKKGVITKQIGASPNDNENQVADYFANLGYNVLFLAISKTKHDNSPDVKICYKEWEIKLLKRAVNTL